MVLDARYVYLSILLVCGFVIYLFLCLLGFLFDQFIDYFMKAYRFCRTKFKQLREWFCNRFDFGCDP